MNRTSWPVAGVVFAPLIAIMTPPMAIVHPEKYSGRRRKADPARARRLIASATTNGAAISAASRNVMPKKTSAPGSIMPFSLLKNCLCRNSQRISKERGTQHDLRPTHSMHRHAIELLGRLHRLHILLDTKPVEHRHDGFFAGFVKRLPGDLPCDRQLGSNSFFGALFHSFSLVVVGTFCRRFVRSAIVDCRYVMGALCGVAATKTSFDLRP